MNNPEFVPMRITANELKMFDILRGTSQLYDVVAVVNYHNGTDIRVEYRPLELPDSPTTFRGFAPNARLDILRKP